MSESDPALSPPTAGETQVSPPFSAPLPFSKNNKWRELWRGETDGLHLRYNLFAMPASLLPHFAFSRLRTWLYRLGGVSIAPATLICGKLELVGPGAIQTRLRIGSHSQMTAPIYIDVCAPVTIGDHVFIGHHVMLVTTNHEIGEAYQRCGAWKPAPITIENGVWIGANVTILPGVTVGAGAVVAAGALVTKNVPPNTLVGGVPAKVIRELPA